MKSKISFFNKAIFLKNVTLYWPIWGIYTLFLLFAMPFSLWISLSSRYNTNPLSEDRMVSEIYYVITPQYYIFVIAIAAVIMGMALFSYLYKSQSANMIHSLPVDRTELFGTNVISGLAFLIVPQILTFVITILVCLSEGVTKVEYIAMWLLFAMAVAFIAFGFVTVCAFFTGQLVAMPLYVIWLNVFAYVISGVVSYVVHIFGYGISDSGLLSNEFLIWFSPFFNCLSKIDVEHVKLYDHNVNQPATLEFEGIECLVIYFIVAVILYAVAYVVYRMRKIEQAGDLITVEIIKPIFRWGAGTLCGFYVTLFFASIFGGVGYDFGIITFAFGLLFFGSLFYFFADMFVRKTFRVFKKKNWKGCGLFCVALVLTFGALIGYANLEEKRVPDVEDVEYARISMNFSMDYTGDDIQTAIDIHEMILEDVDYYESMNNNTSIYDHREYVHIYYRLKNGTYLDRSYRIPAGQEPGKSVVDFITAQEQQTDKIINNWLGVGYERVNTFEYGFLQIQGYYEKYDELGFRLIDDMSTELTQTQCKKLFNAVIADAEAGTLLKYNGMDDGKWDGEQIIYHIDLQYRIPDKTSARGIYMESSSSNYRYLNIRFGKDCKNIISTIATMGLPYIDSEDDIVWYENGENMPVPEVSLENLIGSYDSKKVNFNEGWMSIGYYENAETGADRKSIYDESYEISAEQMGVLYEAVIKDWLDGKMLKYNLDSFMSYDGYNPEKYHGVHNVFYITLNYQIPGDWKNDGVVVYFSRDCTNIINTIVECGIVESVEDIDWTTKDWDVKIQ
ncbi:MAG: ABC transporter permease [Agathobacter sp.]|nr:ABC transporter permease [Agathobacter sp.]